jgi:hypothetical protein
METRNCQKCIKNFNIEKEDFSFYEKIKVPPPTWCPECRQQRRYAWRNERTLYRRNCDLCHKSIVTIYSPNKPYKVYCTECWWSDNWDTTIYGREFDFSRPFFEQFAELQKDVPRMALLNKRSINSEYTNHSGDNKNAYLSFATFDTENVYYSTWVMKNSRDCTDCSFIYEGGERIYNLVDSRKTYDSQYGVFLRDCFNVYYSYDMHGCSNCFMSHNLRNKSYCIKNVQYTREDYLAKLAEYDLGSGAVRVELYRSYIAMIENDVIHKCAVIERSINCYGNLIFDSKNVKDSFEVDGGEDLKYCVGTPETKNSMDLYHVGWNTTELAYECQGCTRIANCQFCHLCYDNMNVMYSDTCQNSQNLFACVSVKKGEYMILNKKYSKEDFENLKSKIIEHMKQSREFGEFFPPSIAPVYYNETQGNYYMPMIKEEVKALGWNWEDNIPGSFGKGTIAMSDIPDNIKHVDDSITKEVLTCEVCTKNFNIVPFELTVYRRDNIPIPKMCPDCRYKKRFVLRPARKLWSGKCKCSTSGHDHTGPCPVVFETPFSPEHKEKVYCRSCYDKEMY